MPAQGRYGSDLWEGIGTPSLRRRIFAARMTLRRLRLDRHHCDRHQENAAAFSGSLSSTISVFANGNYGCRRADRQCSARKIIVHVDGAAFGNITQDRRKGPALTR